MARLKFLNLPLEKILFVAIFTLLLSIIAFSEGIGYNANEITVESEHVLPRVHDLFGPGPETGVGGILYLCIVNISLNPLLYPLSCLSGNEQVLHISAILDYPVLYAGRKYEVISTAKFGAVFPEVCKNFAYYLIVSIIILFLAEKAYNKIS